MWDPLLTEQRLKSFVPCLLHADGHYDFGQADWPDPGPDPSIGLFPAENASSAQVELMAVFAMVLQRSFDVVLPLGQFSWMVQLF